ncbi:molybdenum cofactor biosynthesis protein MoaA [Paramesorhizobium deserti]|uniref:Molybdopterin molybdenumtransferase n=1 Tax=Paramesorhizobium deserti TaxID=1494590 RepID=A0A135HW25_9HYPH|nr:gephyrin-like molybdotransferase Glp [Paramesorhizobium deserti]KXF77358.1 molybdenum cofactor biosynthesis protein MoaA [Paramesorhizobium deserti]
MALLPVDEALARLLAGAEPLGEEILPIAQAGRRVLARPVEAYHTQPPFDASAMDGYAIRADDVLSVPAQLKVIGESAAGRRFAGAVAAGEAVRIFTGAPVPPGADTVLIQENTERLEDGAVRVLQTVSKGRNIRRAGLDFSKSDVLLQPGRVLDPAALSLAAAANNAALHVVRRPKVAIIATGDELVAPGEVPGPDQIISSNDLGIAEIIRIRGGEVLDLGIVGDRIEHIEAAIATAIEKGADVLVTLGGASVGDHDLVHAALTRRGMELDFWKIAMRPGKPLMFGRLQGLCVLGLPGNPVSSLVCGHLFLAPLVSALAGRPYRPDIRRARLGADMPANDQRRDHIRAEIHPNEHGELIATPLPLQDSSMLSALARANGLIIREPHAEPARAGDPCEVLMLR